jgi:hypothetical protein
MKQSMTLWAGEEKNPAKSGKWRSRTRKVLLVARNQELAAYTYWKLYMVCL